MDFKIEKMLENMIFGLDKGKMYRMPLVKLLTRAVLESHMKKIKELQCPYCDRSFKAVHRLKLHIFGRHYQMFRRDINFVINLYRYIKLNMIKKRKYAYLCLPSVSECKEKYRFDNIEHLVWWLQENPNLLNYVISIASSSFQKL